MLHLYRTSKAAIFALVTKVITKLITSTQVPL